jgi:hypothetical protein
MRRALTRAFGVALLLLALVAPRRGHAADARPIVRVVLTASVDAPHWFDGFVKHLERELGLRGIDVVVSRGERDPGTARGGPGSAPLPAADAELVVDAPSALRPVLRFAVSPRGDGGASDVSAAGRVRHVNLAGVPADGCALALAVSADELMRSNWPRAVPSEATRPAAGEGKAATGAGEGTPPATAKPTADAKRPPGAQTDVEATSIKAQAAQPVEAETRDVAADQVAAVPGAGTVWHSNLAVVAAGEAFAGGQTQLGGDLRYAIRVTPRLEIEVRGGWRHILRQTTTHGAIDGNVFVGGGALRLLVLGGARATLSAVGRADVLRVAYSGDPRDASIDAMSGNAMAVVVAAGPSGRLWLTRSLALEAEVLAGASPLATTATDAQRAVFSTNGAAILGGLGLSLGL